jgi:hypothetical protein
VQPLQSVRKLVYQSCSRLIEALGAPLIRVTLDTFMMMFNDDDNIYGSWYFSWRKCHLDNNFRLLIKLGVSTSNKYLTN